MKTLSAPTLAALAGKQVGIVQLVLLDFPSLPLALNMSTWDLTWLGVVYKGAYGLGTISAVQDKPGEIAGITLELAAGDSSIIALALDDSDIVQGTPVTIRTAIIDLETYQVLDAPIDWVGSLDTMSIGEDGTQAAIRCTAESKAVDLLRGNPQFYADQDQRAIAPNDASFSYVVDQIDKPLIWPTRAFYYK